MFASLTSRLLESVSDVSQNPIAVLIFGIISLLILLLLLAIVFPFWRTVLTKTKILEEDEHPASFLLWIVSIVIIVKVVQVFLLQPFIVDGGSMLPTFHNKEFLLVDKLSYRMGNPARGDVVIFKLYEPGAGTYKGKYLIKRVMGLPGDRVVIWDGKTTIYNEANPGGFLLEENFVTHKDVNKNTETVLGPEEYFVMGDNRTQSYDSRDWGTLHRENVRGRVLFRVYPIDAFGYVPGQHRYER